MAFRDLHGSRLHGFALLVSLGDPRMARKAADKALTDGARHAATLRHPERAAAWLRRAALRRLRPARAWRRGPSEATRREALAALGVDAAAYDGLAGVSLAERALLVAASVERFELSDVEAIFGRSRGTILGRLAGVRRRYLQAALASGASGPPALDPHARQPDGELARRIRAAAARAMGSAGTGA